MNTGGFSVSWGATTTRGGPRAGTRRKGSKSGCDIFLKSIRHARPIYEGQTESAVVKEEKGGRAIEGPCPCV